MTHPTAVTLSPDAIAPPQALDAERAVLAAMMLTPEAASRAAALLKPEAFYRTAHSTIFRALVTIAARGERADLVTLCDELRQHGELEAIGGPPTISHVLEYATTTANLEQHARIVSDAHRRLLAQRAADRLSEAARTGEVPIGKAWERCKAEMEDAAAPVGGTDEFLRAAVAGPAFMELTLDAPLNLLGDGLLPAGTLGMIHASSGAGKTFLAEQLAHAVATGDPWLGLFATPPGGVPVVLVQLEVSPYELQKRRRTRYPQGTPNLHTITADAIGRNINILDAEDFERIVRLIQGVGARLVIFDPAQELHGDGIEDNAAWHVFVRQLKLLMLKTGVAVLLVHHEPKAPVEKGSARSDLDSARGGTRLSGACKLQMRLKHSLAGHWSLAFAKVSFGPKPHDVPLAQTPDGWWDATEAPVPAADRTRQAVRVYLEHAGENGAEYADLERASGRNRNTVRAALDALAIESGLSGWADLNVGTYKRPRFVLPSLNSQSASQTDESIEQLDF